MTMILNKGQSATIRKENGQPVMDITVGANWGKIDTLTNGLKTGVGFFDKLVGKATSAVGAKESVDLDLSVLTFDAQGQLVDRCYFGNQRPNGDVLIHTGDDRQGDDEDDGLDNERIQIKSLKLAQTRAQTAVIVLNNFTQQPFEKIPYIRLGIYDGLFGLRDKAPRLIGFDLTGDKRFTGAKALIMAKMVKGAQGWELVTIGEPTPDSSILELQRRIQNNYL